MSSPFPAKVIRAFDPAADTPAALRLLAQVEDNDQDGEDVSPETFAALLNAPGHDPARDRWVIEAPGNPRALIGCALTWARPVWGALPERAESYLAVHPLYRRQGLGGQLLAQIIRRARELGAQEVVLHANERNQLSNLFLQRRGFQTAGDYWLMQTQLAGPPEDPPRMGLWLVSCAELRDPAVLAQAWQGYRGQWGHYAPAAADGPSEVAWLSQVDPAGVFLALAAGGEPAGACRAVIPGLDAGAPAGGARQLIGVIDAPAVLPGFRELPAARGLVLAALGWLYAKGVRQVALDSWGDAPETIQQYRALGFRAVNHLVSYRLAVSDISDPRR
jgi:ribosomal protein S18 acetylase RimI-like enzyme